MKEVTSPRPLPTSHLVVEERDLDRQGTPASDRGGPSVVALRGPAGGEKDGRSINGP